MPCLPWKRWRPLPAEFDPVLYIIGADDLEEPFDRRPVPMAWTWEDRMNAFDHAIDDTVGLLTDPFQIYGPLWVYRQAGEFVAGRIESALDSVGRFVKRMRRFQCERLFDVLDNYFGLFKEPPQIPAGLLPAGP